MSDVDPVTVSVVVDTSNDEEFARLLQNQEETTARPINSGYGSKMQNKPKRGKRPQRAIEIPDDGFHRDVYPGIGSQPGYTPGIPNRNNTTSDYYYSAWKPRGDDVIVRSDDRFDSLFLCLFIFCFVVILVIFLLCIWLDYL